MVAAFLTPSARQRQLRGQLQQALSCEDAATLQRLSLQVIHRQGPAALQLLMQALADAPQQRFWLDVLQPAAAPKPLAAPAAAEPVSASLAVEAAPPPQNKSDRLEEQSLTSPSEALPVPLEADAEPRLELAQSAPAPEPEHQPAAMEPLAAPVADVVPLPSAPEAWPEPNQLSVEPAPEHHGAADETTEPVGLQEELKYADGPAVQRDEQIKQPIAAQRTPLVTPAPLERSRLHQRLKGWLPRWDASSQQAA